MACPSNLILAVERAKNCHVEKKTTEVKTQKTREADKFSYYGAGTQFNPTKELDELYSKDAKVPMIDLEVFALEYIKREEEEMYNTEMAKLQEELTLLEPGKYFHRIHAVRACP